LTRAWGLPGTEWFGSAERSPVIDLLHSHFSDGRHCLERWRSWLPWHYVRIQADIYRIPLRPEMFDYVLCLGVLQHTPGPREAFLQLVELLKPGGKIAIDSYKLSWKTPFKPSFWLRPITNKLPPEVLWKAARWWFPRLLPLRRFVRKHVPNGDAPAEGRVGLRMGHTQYI